VTRKRQSYSEDLKREVAQGYASKTLSSKEIEARGIRMGNVHRWVAKYAGPGATTNPNSNANSTKVKLEEGGTISTTSAPPTSVPDIHTLSKRQLKRGANGRYDPIVREAATAALATMSVLEVSEITGVNQATLYAWKNSTTPPQRASPGTALIPANGRSHAGVATAELLINPASTDALLNGISKSEGFANLSKSYENKIRKFRAGWIELDEDDHRFCLGFLQLTGGKPMRSRK
jgi:transposase-like protein